jgi:signal transduction histidine kinase
VESEENKKSLQANTVTFLEKEKTLLEEKNAEILAQQEQLEQQAAEIQTINTALQESNVTLQQAMEELEQKNTILSELNEEKNEFIGIASHDLRSPILGILLSAQTGKVFVERNEPTKVIDKLSLIEQASERMIRIVQNLLDINAIESGAITLHLEHTNIREVVKQCVTEYEGRAEEKGIHLESHIPSSMELRTDKDKIHEIVGNLLSNALKFSHSQSTIQVRLYAEENYACISVKDQGQGMTEEDQKRLFQKFARLSSTPTAGEDSTGLGLAIVKRLTDEINGTVTCESEKGIGTQFTIKLPMQS